MTAFPQGDVAAVSDSSIYFCADLVDSQCLISADPFSKPALLFSLRFSHFAQFTSAWSV
jgi:hypothetical protein